jgi:hypothetical protein
MMSSNYSVRLWAYHFSLLVELSVSEVAIFQAIINEHLSVKPMAPTQLCLSKRHR